MRHRADANHQHVRSALRAAGWLVCDMSQSGDGMPDLVAVKAGRVEFVEVKDGAKVKSARKLTPAQERLHANFRAAGVTVRVITNVSEAVNL